MEASGRYACKLIGARALSWHPGRAEKPNCTYVCYQRICRTKEFFGRKDADLRERSVLLDSHMYLFISNECKSLLFDFHTDNDKHASSIPHLCVGVVSGHS